MAVGVNLRLPGYVLVAAMYGYVLGRSRLLILLAQATPFVIWGVWLHYHYGGPNDDVSGSIAIAFTLFAWVGILIGIGVRQFRLRSRRTPH